MTRSLGSSIAAIALCAAVGVACAPCAIAQGEAVSAEATIGGQDVTAASGGHPVNLVPGQGADVVVDLTNHGQVPVEVTLIQLSGRVIGLTFFSYASSLETTLAPGASGTVRYRLDLTGLQGQATGLIGAELAIRDHAGGTVAVLAFPADVRGSLLSVYGMFGLALIVLTALSLVDAALALARQRLSVNRWRRALRLMTPGVGFGLVLAFSASALRWWLPSTGQWLLIAGLTAATFFALGYFSPTPARAHPDMDDIEDIDCDPHIHPDALAHDFDTARSDTARSEEIGR